MAKRKTPEQVAVLAERQVDEALATVMLFRVKSQADYDDGMDILRDIKTQMTSLKASRDSLTDPLMETLARIKTLFKAPEDRLKAADAAVRLAMSVFATEQQAKVKQQQEKLAQGKVKSVAAALAKIEETKTGGTATRKVLRITDETKIPKTFFKCTPDEKKIKESWQHGLPVPGTSWDDEVGIVVRNS